MKITQTALDMVKDSTKALLGEYLDVVKKSLTVKLKDSIGHDFEFSQDMDDLFAADSVFTGRDSEREQRSFYLYNKANKWFYWKTIILGPIQEQ